MRLRRSQHLKALSSADGRSGYDAQGERVKRSETGAGAKSYLVDEQNPTGLSWALAEIDDSSLQPTTQYVVGNEMLAQTGVGNARQQLHGDLSGSTRLLTDAAGNTITNSDFDYTPWGESLGGSSSLTSLRFTGQWQEPELGLQHHRARWLKLAAGNWLSEDPVFDFPGNFGNAYAYAGDDPINQRDLQGTETSMNECFAAAQIAGELAAGLSFKIGNLPYGLSVIYESADTFAADMFFSILMIAISCIPIIGDIIDLATFLPDLKESFMVITGQVESATPLDIVFHLILLVITFVVILLPASKILKSRIDAAKDWIKVKRARYARGHSPNSPGSPGGGGIACKGECDIPKDKFTKAELDFADWTPNEVNGRTVHQNNSLIDPDRMVHRYDDEGNLISLTNRQRMKKGLGPEGPDGEIIQMHHIHQTEPDDMMELTATKHRKVIHDKEGPSWRHEEGKEEQYEKWRTEYWKTRANDFP